MKMKQTTKRALWLYTHGVLDGIYEMTKASFYGFIVFYPTVLIVQLMETHLPEEEAFGTAFGVSVLWIIIVFAIWEGSMKTWQDCKQRAERGE